MNKAAENIRLLILSLVVCFLTGELIMRIFFKTEISRETLEKNILQASDVRELIRPNEDPDIYYELIPSMEKTFKGSIVKTNPEGMRVGADNTEKMRKTEQTMLIVGIGDSTMFGWGIDQKDTYLQQLEDLLNASDHGCLYKVLNLAVPGYNSEQELAVFKKKILRMKPNILVLHYDHNDSDPIGDEYLPDYIAPEVGDNFLHSALVKWVIRRVTYAENKNRIYVKGENKRFQNYIFEGPAYSRHLEALRQLSDLAEKNHIPVFVVLFDTWIERALNQDRDIHYQVLHKKLIPFMTAQGFHILDFYDIFQAYMKENGLHDLKTLWISPSDGHPNAKGHRIIAESLYRMISDSVCNRRRIHLSYKTINTVRDFISIVNEQVFKIRYGIFRPIEYQ